MCACVDLVVYGEGIIYNMIVNYVLPLHMYLLRSDCARQKAIISMSIHAVFTKHQLSQSINCVHLSQPSSALSSLTLGSESPSAASPDPPQQAPVSPRGESVMEVACVLHKHSTQLCGE